MGTMSGVGVLFSVLLNYQTVIILRWQLKVKTEKDKLILWKHTNGFKNNFSILSTLGLALPPEDVSN